MTPSRLKTMKQKGLFWPVSLLTGRASSSISPKAPKYAIFRVKNWFQGQNQPFKVSSVVSGLTPPTNIFPSRRSAFFGSTLIFLVKNYAINSLTFLPSISWLPLAKTASIDASLAKMMNPKPLEAPVLASILTTASCSKLGTILVKPRTKMDDNENRWNKFFKKIT